MFVEYIDAACRWLFLLKLSFAGKEREGLFELEELTRDAKVEKRELAMKWRWWHNCLSYSPDRCCFVIYGAMSQRDDRFPWINVVNVNVLDNPTSVTNPFQFEIIFEACQDLQEGSIPVAHSHRLDLEWKLTYVGDYRSTDGDQILDSVLVGPITRGTHKFCFQVGFSPSRISISHGRRQRRRIWQLCRPIAFLA